MAATEIKPGGLPDMATLIKLKAQSHGEIDKSTLVDIRDITIDTTLPLAEKMASFIQQIKNPYVFRYKDKVVKISFADTEVTFEERIKDYFEMH